MTPTIRRAVLVRSCTSIVLALALPVSASLAQALDVTPERVVVGVPAPGHTSSWEASATNSGHDELSVYLVVRDVEGAAAAGAHPAMMSVHDADGAEILPRTPLPEIGSSPVLLGSLPPADVLTLVGEVSLPRSAGNEYQGAVGSLVLDLVTMDSSAGPGGSAHGPLATTGARLAAALVAVLVLVGLGVWFVAGARRRQTDDEVEP